MHVEKETAYLFFYFWTMGKNSGVVMEFKNPVWVGHPPEFQAILRPKLFNNGNPREEPFSFSVSSIYLLFPWLEAEPSEAAEANPETTVEAAISLNRRTTLCVCSSCHMFRSLL